ncbi:MAG: DUF3604 domain-containing protein [Alphaproteobacteria bacterium]|nr:DUF3604 domain-containing protein [Alphaproteobacteria bacterium]
MSKGKRRLTVGASAMAISLVAGTAAVMAQQQPYSPGVGEDYPKNVYFGDLHHHTRNSPDAYIMGDTNLSPADAYRFARGEEVVASNGVKARLKRPLDFLAVTDHAEYIGAYYRFDIHDPLLVDSQVGKRWQQLIDAGKKAEMMGEFVSSVTDRTAPNQPSPDRYKLPEDFQKSVWQDVARTADQYNEPGVFTAFSGYEWTSMLDGNNLHRCVIFKDGWKTVTKVLPFSAQDSIDPEDLWRYLSRYEQKTGGEVIAIPHNSNLSNGLMFADETLMGKPLTKAYAETRSRWEPIVEVTQIKGDSETDPVLSPTDEFADFERWDEYNIMGTHKTTPDMLPGSYARSALKKGLAFEAKLGANPFKFGMIGSTDEHTSLSTTSEDNFFGKFKGSEPSADRWEQLMAHLEYAPNWKLSASGLAAVWATENTRDALFAAMKRREVYATTGSRIVVRFFGGWDYKSGDVSRPDYVKVGYKEGVPMGGDLTHAPQGKAPVFMVMAAKDPEDANLDRIQIIKGWLDAAGKTHEKIYDVALSNGRKVDPQTGKAPPVGSTVDVKNASYDNSIGAAQLATVWSDPDFDASQRSFYYARVIEIPKPRWTAYDAKFYQIDMPEKVPMTVQDRAYTSPIWYTP